MLALFVCYVWYGSFDSNFYICTSFILNLLGNNFSLFWPRIIDLATSPEYKVYKSHLTQYKLYKKIGHKSSLVLYLLYVLERCK